MSLLNLTFLLKGYPIFKARKLLNKIQDMSHEQLADYHEKMKWDIFHYHLSHNSVYKNFVGIEKINSWTDIPILTKSAIQIPLKDRLGEGFTPKNTHVHNTSGSSGTPFFFAKDKFCHALSWAIIYNRFSWHKINIGKHLQARFYGIPLTFKKYWIEQIKDRIAQRSRFPVFDLSDNILDKYLIRFRNFKFKYINGYTSSLVLFARYLNEKQIVLKDECTSLKVVFTTSEVCDEIDRGIMEKAFGVKIVNEYGAAEIDLIGFEDAEGDWLLNFESIFVEVVDDDGKPVEVGSEGRILITSLYNKAMPFIRYELGDRVILSAQKKGKYQLIKKVVGRVNDIALLPSGKKAPGLTFYYISKGLLEGGGFMKEFIIKQKTINHFEFEYVAERSILMEEKKLVIEALNKYLEPGLKATFVKMDKLERTQAGKLKHFFSELPIS